MLTHRAPSLSKAFELGALRISVDLLLHGNETVKSIYDWKILSPSLALINFLTTKITFSDDKI
jgi:hypothetical protein